MRLKNGAYKLAAGGLLAVVLMGGSIVLRPRDKGAARETKPIRAAVVTHHLLAEEMIKDLGQRLQKTPGVKRVVIVGPNHDELGENNIISDKRAEGVIIKDEEIVGRDHACQAPKGVLKEYLPGADFECILTKKRTSPEEVEELIKTLKRDLGKEGVLVASVDFSHYLPLEEANKNDAATQGFLEKLDSNSLQRLGNNYLDSPKSIDILFSYIKDIGATEFKIVDHLNSAQILRRPDTASTTSYFEIVYY